MVDAHSWRRARPAHARAGTTVLPPSALLGVGLGVLAVTESIVRSAVTETSLERALVLCLLGLATTLPLSVAAEQPAAVAAVSAAVVSVALFHALTIAALMAQLAVLYRFASVAGPSPARQAVAVALPFAFLVLALVRPVPSASEAGVLVLLLAALAPAAALAGLARRARGEAVRHDAERQAAAGDLLEHVARGERARIARELHDVVAHHISMIAVQAETARLTTPGMPAAGTRSLGAIGDTARSALTEMRRLLGVLREDADADGPELSPQPGLEQLGQLLDLSRDASGSAARLILSGRPRELDPGVELAAYRIVQEALTNARRHAPGAAVDVELHYGPQTVELRIRDNGPGPGPGPAVDATVGGHGLTGMRERAAAVGGRLRTGPALGGGFFVEARLPGERGGSVT